jgi:hypothetical protein
MSLLAAFSRARAIEMARVSAFVEGLDPTPEIEGDEPDHPTDGTCITCGDDTDVRWFYCRDDRPQILGAPHSTELPATAGGIRTTARDRQAADCATGRSAEVFGNRTRERSVASADTLPAAPTGGAS